MAKNNLVAKKYAEALVTLDASESTLQELKLVTNSLLENLGLKSSLENPSVTKETKFKILDEVFGSKVAKNTLNLLKLCISKRRTNIIGLLAKHYEAAYLRINNIELAKIETSSDISNQELEDIKTQLEKVFNTGIKIEAKNNPELLAGIKINVNNKVIDYSLKSKIKKLNQSLKS